MQDRNANEAMDFRFMDGDVWCENELRSDRALSDLTDGVRRHLEKFLFTAPKVLAKHFNTLVPTISRILKTHLGLHQFSGRWVPHELTDG
jgi:hypothetical protein